MATEHDARAIAHDGAITVTPEREQAWRNWVLDYASNCMGSYIAGGATREQALEAAAIVVLDFEKIDGMSWMTLGDAITWNAEMGLADRELHGAERLEYMRSVRTFETATEVDRALAAAFRMGVGAEHFSSYFPGIDLESAPRRESRTALYRHWDASGKLLYLGISHDPAARSEQHRRRSPWFKFVSETSVAWFETRDQAASAERAAIRSEAPVFNHTHNKANRDAALAYLFAAIGPEAPAFRSTERRIA